MTPSSWHTSGPDKPFSSWGTLSTTRMAVLMEQDLWPAHLNLDPRRWGAWRLYRRAPLFTAAGIDLHFSEKDL